MRRTCKKCHTIIEIDERRYAPGSVHKIDCPGCGEPVEFVMPGEYKAPIKDNGKVADKSQAESRKDKKMMNPAERKDHNRIYPEMKLSTKEAYTGRIVNRWVNLFISLSAMLVVVVVIYLFFVYDAKKTQKVRVEEEFNGEAIELADKELGKPLEAMLDSAITQHYKGESVKVYRGEFHNANGSWPVRLAIKNETLKNGELDAIYYNMTGNYTSIMKVRSEDKNVYFYGKVGETPLRITVKYDSKSGRWEGEAVSNYKLDAWLIPTDSSFK